VISPARGINAPGRLPCGCAAIARRRCELCAPEVFLTCGADCLRRHLEARHAGAGDSRGRALAFQAEVNHLGTGARAAYEGHRERIMRLVSAVQRADGLCVLGAGNGHDLDLPFLTRIFGAVHLVDIDGDALARAVTDLPAAVRARVTIHAGVDLSGCLDHLDAWGEHLPDEEELTAIASASATAIAGRLGRTFDVVLSACVLSQLCHPFQNTLALPRRGWQRLFAAVTRVHLATVALLTRPGGTGVLACDVLCQAGTAIDELRAQVGRARLGDALIAALASGAIAPHPDPRALARELESADFAALISRVFVTEPWLWDLGPTVQIVYGILLRRA
jgi:hypothetical protein